jgi:hypothetical protein
MRETWTLPRRVQFLDVTFVTALESYLDLLIAAARYGRKLTLFTYPIRKAIERIDVIESDSSLSKPDRERTRNRLIRECDAALGTCLRLAAKHGRTHEVADVVSKQWPLQKNQENVFRAYRTVLRREGRPPTIREWVEQDLIERPPNFSRLVERNPKERARRVRDYKRNRGHVIREMAKRFKLAVTAAS